MEISKRLSVILIAGLLLIAMSQPSIAGGKIWEIKKIKIDQIDKYYEEIPSAGGAGITLHPDKGYQLIKVKFELTALIHDSNAVGNISKLREEFYNSYPDNSRVRRYFRKELTLDQKKGLTGKYQVFNLQDITLTDSYGRQHKPLWAANPKPGNITFYWKDDGLYAVNRGENPDKWHHIVRSKNTLFGLLEIKQLIPISLVFSIPEEVKSNEIKIGIKGQS
ncbi:MAG: hypothetical protein KKE44_19580 [Proteobacteria bacterium]|nr:hypothetical protein [Pseudomonadota bacterium]MBU1584935.1 hypothetical protein [Pseudomonadota bacterium]MBU2456210.1 hypothetical protein [Pseudomonadota bacterium]